MPSNLPGVTADLLTKTPVTVAVHRRAEPGRAREVNAWLHTGVRLAETFPGFLGAGWVRPADDTEDWHVLYRFSGGQALAGWESSPERAWWLAGAEGLVVHERTERRTGIEGWFDTADSMIAAEQESAAITVPPRWKQAVSTSAGLYPIQLLSAYFLVPHLAHLATPLRVLITTAIVIPIMLYAVLPPVTRLLRGWLHG
jgi:antibiotic biosynthesis monooxygenase (ABM) superfamily enzyme